MPARRPEWCRLIDCLLTNDTDEPEAALATTDSIPMRAAARDMAEREPVRLSALHSRDDRCWAEALLRARVREAGTAFASLLRAGAWPRQRPVTNELRGGREQGHVA